MFVACAEAKARFLCRIARVAVVSARSTVTSASVTVGGANGLGLILTKTVSSVCCTEASARVAVGIARKLVAVVCFAVWIATNAAAIAGSAVTSARLLLCFFLFGNDFDKLYCRCFVINVGSAAL